MIMTKQQIFLMVRKNICDLLNIKPDLVNMNSNLQYDLGADSLDELQLLYQLESKLHYGPNQYLLDNAENEKTFFAKPTVGTIVDIIYKNEISRDAINKRNMVLQQSANNQR